MNGTPDTEVNRPAVVRLAQGLRGFFQGKGADALRNFGWLLGEKGLRLVLGYTVLALLARYLGPSDFGVLSYSLALVGLLMFIPALGLDDIVKSEVLKSRESASAVMGTAMRMRLAVGAALMAVVTIFLWTGRSPETAETKLLWVLTGLFLQPALLVPELFFQARGQARYTTWSQTGALVAGATLRLVLISSGAGLFWFGVAVLGELVLAGFLLAVFARRQDCAGWWKEWDPVRARKMMAAAWPLMLSGAAVMLYMRIDQVMLRHLAGEESAGIYAAAVRLSEVVYFIPILVVTGLLPYWVEARARGTEAYERALQGIFDLQTALALGFAVPVAFLADWLVGWVFGPAYAAAGPVLAVHVWAAIFVFQGVSRSQAWVLEEWNMYTLVTTVVGAVANVVLNYLWIPRYGAIGAAVATLVSYALAAWAMSFFFARTRRIAWIQTKSLLLPLFAWRYLVKG